jgi:hypothetical protein
MAVERTTTKAFQVILLLSASDRKQLLRFLQSPYFNTSQILLKLAEAFLKEAENTPDERYDKCAVWKKLFKAQAFNDTLFRKHCSDLYKLIEEFLVVEQLKTEASKKNLKLFEVLVSRKMEPLYQTVLNSVRQGESAKQRYSANEYYDSFQLEKTYTRMMNFDLKPTDRSNAQELSENLDVYYWIEKIQICYSVLSQRKTQTYNYDIRLLEEIVEIVPNLPLDRHPMLAIYFYIFLTRKEESNQEHYFKLKELVWRYKDQIPASEGLPIFDPLLNYCIGRLNARDEPFWEEYLQNFKIALELGVLTQNESIGEPHYNNAVASALRLKEFGWVEHFVLEYKKYLNPSIRENTYNFAMARVYFHQKKYSEILDKFAQVEFGDMNYSLIGKSILAMTYYEEDLYGLLDTHLDSFKVFMNRHKDIPTDRKLGFANFIKYMKRLMKIMPRDREAKEKLRAEILENKASVRNYEWLLEKVSGE